MAEEPIDAAPAEAAADPASFGRVDPDGTVWVRTADGDFRVGQFQAGSAEDALAYYTRKFASLETEVALLEQRLGSGADVAVQEATVTVTRLQAAVAEPAAVGDYDALRTRVEALPVALDERQSAARAARAAARQAAVAAREAIVVEAETLADSTAWKSAGDRLRGLLEAWKAAPRVDRPTEQALWKRFSAARNTFDRHRRAHFGKLATEQGEAKVVKAAIVAEAEALSGSTDWGATAGEYRRLMERWKASPRAGRQDEDALWTRFRAAQDAFFAARATAMGERDAGQAQNLAAKEALAIRAESLVPVQDLGAAKAALRDIQDEWEKVGHVPRADKDKIEGRLRRVEQAVRDSEQQRWKRSNPEARARAQDTVDQLTATIARLEEQRVAAQAAGEDAAAAQAVEAIEARRAWLAEAERALAEFSDA